MFDNCSALELVRVRSPGIVLSSSSRMSVTADSTTRGFAPGSTVWTEMTGGSMSGYSRTDSSEYPMTPNSTRPALIMLASTGRRMEMSDSFMGASRLGVEEPAGHTVHTGVAGGLFYESIHCNEGPKAVVP